VPLAGGGDVTAIDIQRHYMTHARNHLNALPDWASPVCDLWERTLDHLTADPMSMSTTLDWAIKFSLFSNRLRQNGFDWDNLPRNGQAGPLAALRQQMFEIDIRFGQLGERGIHRRRGAAVRGPCSRRRLAARA